MGYASTYRNYFILEINKGDLVQSKRFSHKRYEKFKKSQFLAYQQTEEYQKAKAELKEKGYDEKLIENFLRNFIINYSSKILVSH